MRAIFKIDKDPKDAILTNRSKVKHKKLSENQVNKNIQPKSMGRIHKDYSIQQ